MSESICIDIDPITMGRIERYAEKMGLSVEAYLQKIFADKVDDTSAETDGRPE